MFLTRRLLSFVLFVVSIMAEKIKVNFLNNESGEYPLNELETFLHKSHFSKQSGSDPVVNLKIIRKKSLDMFISALKNPRRMKFKNIDDFRDMCTIFSLYGNKTGSVVPLRNKERIIKKELNADLKANIDAIIIRITKILISSSDEFMRSILAIKTSSDFKDLLPIQDMIFQIFRKAAEESKCELLYSDFTPELIIKDLDEPSFLLYYEQPPMNSLVMNTSKFKIGGKPLTLRFLLLYLTFFSVKKFKANVDLNFVEEDFNSVRRCISATDDEFGPLEYSSHILQLKKIDIGPCEVNEATFRSLIGLVSTLGTNVHDLVLKCRISDPTFDLHDILKTVPHLCWTDYYMPNPVI